MVPIYDHGEIDGQLFLEMRLIDGTDLSTLLEVHGKLSPPRAVALVHQVAAALDAAHAVGVIHGDVKPQNILITRDDFACLADFGIADAATYNGATQVGSPVGTWKYTAPERFTDAEVTDRVDVYALASRVIGSGGTGITGSRGPGVSGSRGDPGSAGRRPGDI